MEYKVLRLLMILVIITIFSHALPNKPTEQVQILVPKTAAANHPNTNKVKREQHPVIDLPVQPADEAKNGLQNQKYNNVITVPDNCPEGQKMQGTMADCNRIVYPDKVEEVKDAAGKTDATTGGDGNTLEQRVEQPDITRRYFIQVPDNCPPGYKMGPDGVCREVFE